MTCQVLTLQLIKGVPSPYSLGAPAGTPYDPQPLVIDFLTGVWKVKDDSTGTTGYDPGIAGLKNGGVNVDSPLLDNILPIAAPVGVVTDGLRITSNSPEESKSTALSEIMDVLRSASSFFFDTVYNEPVYLKVQLTGDAGPRYALIYDFTSDDIGDMLSNEPHEIVFTFIREAYWRWLAPGANPKLYAFDARDLEPNVDYDYTDLDLGSPTSGDTAPYFVEDMTNSCRFSGTNILNTERNYIDIDAEDVPGDAPALLQLKVGYLASGYENQAIWIARKTRRNMDSGSVLATMNHNGADADITTDAAPTNVTRTFNSDATNGILSDPPGATVQGRYTLRVTYSTGAITDNQRIARWSRPLNKNLGRVRCLVRTRLNSGTVTNAQFQVALGRPSLIAAGFYSEIEEGPVFDLSANSTPSNVAIYDAGVFDLSFWGNPLVIGTGIGADEATNYIITLKTVGRGVVGSNTVVDIVDIILLPYDEYAVQIPGGGNAAYADTTGYFNRGSALPKAATSEVDVLFPSSAFTGNPPLLEPNKDARLYFLYGNINDVSTVGGTAVLAGSVRVTGNIIPRSRHLRDRL